jgi:hypothetical protein
MDTESENPPRDVIVAALLLAKERLTGELDVKEIQRERIADLIVRAALYGDNQSQPERPTAADFTQVLGDPDDRLLREAISAW